MVVGPSLSPCVVHGSNAGEASRQPRAAHWPWPTASTTARPRPTSCHALSTIVDATACPKAKLYQHHSVRLHQVRCPARCGYCGHSTPCIHQACSPINACMREARRIADTQLLVGERSCLGLVPSRFSPGLISTGLHQGC